MRYSRSRRDVPAMISILASFGAVLCAGPMTASAQSAPDPFAEQQESPAFSVVGADGEIVAEVVANGTGCPAGTWDADIAADGSNFTLAFDEYKVTVAPQTPFDVLSCQITIRLSDMLSKSYAVAAFGYEGRVVLGADVRGKVTTKYYFQGSVEDGQRMQDAEFVGPREEHFKIIDSVELEDLNWSACGPQRDLNVQTNIVLNNNAAETGSGSLNLSSAEGPGSLVLRLASQGC